MSLPDYETLYERACERKGGAAAVEALLPQVADRKQLRALGSDRYLAEFTRKIFQSGFVWRVVDKKWKDFEEVFWNFDIQRLLMMPDDMLDRKAANPAIAAETGSFVPTAVKYHYRVMTKSNWKPATS